MILTVTATVAVSGTPAESPTSDEQPPRRICRNRHCGDRLNPEPGADGTTYCWACADLADEHDQGEHDHDSHEFCPACQP